MPVESPQRPSWTAERVAQAIRDWNELYGSPPAAADWAPRIGPERLRARRQARLDAGHWPAYATVARYYRTWNEAIAAAGFTPRPPGAAARYTCPVPRTPKRGRPVLWTEARIIAAIQRWDARYGQPPRERDWTSTEASDEERQRFRQGNWPCAATVANRFGTWDKGLLAAGFAPRPGKRRGHHPRTSAAIARDYRELGSVRAVARRRGRGSHYITSVLRDMGINIDSRGRQNATNPPPTAQAVLDAIGSWRAQHGKFPAPRDWKHADDGQWPTPQQVRDHFGSHTKAVLSYRIAELETYAQGLPPTHIPTVLKHQLQLLRAYRECGNALRAGAQLGLGPGPTRALLRRKAIPTPKRHAQATPEDESAPRRQDPTGPLAPRDAVMEVFDLWHELTGALPTRTELDLTVVANVDIDALFGSYNAAGRCWHQRRAALPLIPSIPTRAEPIEVAAELRRNRATWERVGLRLGVPRERARTMAIGRTL